MQSLGNPTKYSLLIGSKLGVARAVSQTFCERRLGIHVTPHSQEVREEHRVVLRPVAVHIDIPNNCSGPVDPVRRRPGVINHPSPKPLLADDPVNQLSFSDVRWSPTGDRLAIVYNSGGHDNIAVMPVSVNGTPAAVTYLNTGRFCHSPAWDHTGDVIVFLDWAHPTSVRQVHVATQAVSDLLTSNLPDRPADIDLASDGNFAVATALGDLWVGPDAISLNQVDTHPTWVVRARWSPSADRLLYGTGAPSLIQGDWKAFSVTVNGNLPAQPDQIVPPQGNPPIYRPTWSPDGSAVAAFGALHPSSTRPPTEIWTAQVSPAGVFSHYSFLVNTTLGHGTALDWRQ